MSDRRNFVKTTITASLGIGLFGGVSELFGKTNRKLDGKRIGMVGLDTGHCISFTKLLNANANDGEFNGYKVVAAYP